MKKSLYLLLIMLNFSFAQGLKVQILGSGGPELTDNRASSSYLIYLEDKAKILVDFGSGAAFNFERTKAKIENIDFILLTHLHIDHTNDLPAFLKASYFSNKTNNLNIYGPYKGSFVPKTSEFINRLFENKKGAWEYMGDFLDGTASYKVETNDIKFSKEIKSIYNKGDLRIEAITVHHGPIPALAYSITYKNKKITISGDMSNKYRTLEKLAKNSDLLIAHNAVPKGAKGIARNLHMTPKEIGIIAKNAKVKKLILSHIMNRTNNKKEESLEEINKNYLGQIDFAQDNKVYTIF